MDEKEIRVQIALGTLPTAPNDLAKIIRRTDSLDLIEWGLQHNTAKVKASALANPLCPITDVIRCGMLDRRKQVQEVIDRVIDKRDDEINYQVNLLEQDPVIQLELDFG